MSTTLHKVRIEIPGEPVAKERPRLNRRTGNVYTPRSTIGHEELVAWHVAGTRVRFGRQELALRVEFHCASIKRPDLDNLIKTLLDGLQKGGLFDNDWQIARLEAWRILEAEDPRTIVEAWGATSSEEGGARPCSS